MVRGSSLFPVNREDPPYGRYLAVTLSHYIKSKVLVNPVRSLLKNKAQSLATSDVAMELNINYNLLCQNVRNLSCFKQGSK